MSFFDIKILIVDDEVNSTILLKKVLQKKGYNADTLNNSAEAFEKIKTEDYDIIISDLQMPEFSGSDLLKVKKENTLFIMITGYGSIDSAVESMKLGAFDYISKPFDINDFLQKFEKAADKIRLSKKYNQAKDCVDQNNMFCSMVGNSRKMKKVYELINNVAQTDANVLIEGQSGTGKELAARAIHLKSTRSKGPFIAINCSSIPENLLESELFGHTKGAFTGAVDSQKGVFELAHNGTLLLDEIAEMPYQLQSKLLRVIETWEIKPLGSDKVKKVNCRLISATNRNLKEYIEQKKFREDLFYRISSVIISLPPLNERTDDIPLLAEYFLKNFSAKMKKQLTLSPDAIELLEKTLWKGNVRELENAIERAVINSSSQKLTKTDFNFLDSSSSFESSSLAGSNVELKELEKIHIQKVLEENNWNKLQTAKILGIDRKTLYKKLKEYNIE